MDKSEKTFNLLSSRGFIFQTSNQKGVEVFLNSGKGTIYEGFDPSAESLHLGHLMSLVLMNHLQKAGFKLIFILGGGTGRVGDPTDKKASRKLLSPETVTANGEKIKKQVEGMSLVRFSGENPALMVDNNLWLSSFSFMDDFMMKVAKVFSVNEMIKMRTFADRLKDQDNVSLMEFCYPVLQAWDFLELYERYECTLQIGGQDQWTNILQGVDLVGRTHKAEVFAMTLPLLVTSSGEKMGKTANGPIWLDPEKTSPFDFFQYLIQTPDSLLEKMLKLFTFLPLEEIDKAIKDPRSAQRLLAFEVTKIVHGEDQANSALKDSEKLFGEKEGQTDSVPKFKLPDDAGLPLDQLLVEAKALPSKTEVGRRCLGGAVEIDEVLIQDPKFLVNKECIIKFGKSAFLKIEK